MMKKFLLAIFLTSTIHSFSQEQKINETEITINQLIKGTLFSPERISKQTKLVILIAGSGPTNRSGNQIGMRTNAYRYLAQSLAQEGIAVFSYDKRIIAQIIDGTIDEKTLTFEDFITDAKEVILHFKSKNDYSKIIIAGHSEGSIIGTVAALNYGDAFISIAGPGRPIHEILLEQLVRQNPGGKDEIKGYLDQLKAGQTVKVKSGNPAISTMFRENVQPFLISCIRYDPVAEIRKLKIGVLIVSGTKDLQVMPIDAESLKNAKPDATLKIITNMNHVLKEIKGENSENTASYNNPNLPVMPELIAVVSQFVKSI